MNGWVAYPPSWSVTCISAWRWARSRRRWNKRRARSLNGFVGNPGLSKGRLRVCRSVEGVGRFKELKRVDEWPSIRAALFFPVAEGVEQVFNGPVRTLGGEQIGGGAVLPDSVANRGGRVGLQLGLGHQPAQITGQNIATAALGEQGVAGAIDKNMAFASADQCLVAFQHHPAVAES